MWPSSEKHDPAVWLAPLATGLIALGVYLLTLPPGLTWAHYAYDGGELITASITWGIPHPPGYPTYTLLARIFALLPSGEVAYRYNLFSAVAAAVAGGCVAATTGALPLLQGLTVHRRILVQTGCGLTLAFTPLIWSQATVAEVYTLNLAFVGLTTWSLLTHRSAWLSGILLGLAITTHLTSLALAPFVLLYVPRQKWLHLLAGVGVGVAPYLLLPFLAAQNSPVVWGDPTSFAGWWWLVTGRIYWPNALALPLEQWPERLLVWRGSLLWLLFLAAAILVWRSPQLPARLRWALLLTAFAYLIYAFLYRPADAEVLLLPAVLLLSILLAEPLQRAPAFAPLLPALLLVLNFAGHDLSQDGETQRRAREVFAAAPDSALLMAPGDQTIFTLWYYQHVTGARSDLLLVDANLFAFDWYRQRLARQHPDLTHLAEDDIPGFRMANSHRPVCDVGIADTPFVKCDEPTIQEPARKGQSSR